MKVRNLIVLVLYIAITFDLNAQKIKRYVDFPKHASDPSVFLNMRKSDSTELGFSFKFEKQSNLPLMHKASRILAKQIADKTVATPTISAAELWERRLKNLRMLDNEAEEYLDIPITSSDTIELKDDNEEISEVIASEPQNLNEVGTLSAEINKENTNDIESNEKN